MTRWLVVGAGAAGCVVAGRVAESTDDEVVLLEEGADHGPTSAEVDVGPYLTDPSRVRTDATVIRRPGALPVRYEQGSGLGGSSLVNGAVVVPPAPDWPHRIPLEEPWAVGPLGARVLAAEPDARSLLLTRRDRRRVSAADAYVRPALGRRNLRVATEHTVVRLLVDGRRVVGVATADGREHLADRVVVCAGAIQTPALLLRSSIDTPGIGHGVQDHPAVAVSLELDPGAIDPTAPAISVAIERPGRQIVVVDHLATEPGLGVLMAGLTAVTSTGRVSLPEPDGPPLVELGQLTTPQDRAGLVDVALEALDLAVGPTLATIVRRAVVDVEGRPASSIAGDAAAVAAWAPDHLAGFHHIAASCRMGVVTDDDGAVRGYDGLWLCDASVLRGVPARNPYLAVVGLAERLCDRWLADPHGSR